LATTKSESFYQEGVWRTEWSSLLTGETGDKADLSKWPTKSIQISGTAGAGGSVNIQGSNDGTNWSSLQSATGDSLATAAPGMYSIDQNTQHIRPLVVAGDGTTNLKVVIIAT
jgi:hypothetical protein